MTKIAIRYPHSRYLEQFNESIMGSEPVDIILISKPPFRPYPLAIGHPPWTHEITRDRTAGTFFEHLAELGLNIHYHQYEPDWIRGPFEGTVFLESTAMVTLNLLAEVIT